MGAKEYMMSLILKHKLLSNQLPPDCKTPLEEWMAIKARKTF